MATSPFFGKIICIGTLCNKNPLVLTGEERDILKQFWEIIDTKDRITYISFNGLDFDAPFIVKRSMVYGLKPTNNSFLDFKRYSRYPHFDVKLIISDFDKYAFGNLQLLCDHLQIPSPKEGEIKAENVYDAFLKGQVDKIAEYCQRDVEATYRIYTIIKDYTYNVINKN